MSRDAAGEAWLKECDIILEEKGLLKDIYLNLSTNNICVMKKHVVFEDGVHILLSGKVVYVKTQSAHEVDKKEQLLNSVKTGSFTQLRKNPYEPDPQLKFPCSIIIEEPYAVL